MKQNNKGFTLIELLAVIVILAVIALIATPIIMGVIEDARKQADKDSAYGYIKAVEQTIAVTMTKYPSMSVVNDAQETTTVGTIACQNCPDATGTITINYKGTTPASRQLSYSNGKISGHVKFGDTTWYINDADGSLSDTASSGH